MEVMIVLKIAKSVITIRETCTSFNINRKTNTNKTPKIFAFTICVISETGNAKNITFETGTTATANKTQVASWEN